MRIRWKLGKSASAAQLWAGTGAAVLLTGLPLLAQPPAPTPDQVNALKAQAEAVSRWHPEVITTAPEGLSVILSSRAQARAFYNAIFGLSEGVPSGWTGSLSGTPGGPATGTPGTTSAAFQAAVQLRINWFRAMAGLPAAIAFDSNEGATDQQAALMMAANNALDHTPPSSWQLYTSAGATAAGVSNLSLGVDGPDAITGYIMDGGSNNAAAGHRRWLLYPQTQTMATGDVDATGSFAASNATGIMDGNYNGPRPATRDSYVAWPSPGYVPYQVIFPRWSFAYPGADFSAATVTMTSNGASVPVALEAQSNNPLDEAGESTLVWDYNGLDPATVQTGAPEPSADTPYNVVISGVKIGGVAQTFSYVVTMFDPAVSGPDDTTVTVSGPAAPSVGQNSTYAIAGIPSFANGFQYRTVSFGGAAGSFGAEGGLQGVIANTSAGYNPVDVGVAASGSASYHLATPDGSTQTLTLPGEFMATTGSATLLFASQLGFATAAQVAQVQISLDDGATWTDLYAQAGSGGAGESSFTNHSLALSSYAGLVFEIRLSYTFAGNSSYFAETSNGVGWNIDNIAFTGVSTAVPGSTSAFVSGSTFSYAPASAGAFALQAHALLFGTYALPWGPVLNAIAAVASGAGPAITTQPVSVSVTSGTTAVFNIAATGATGYQWYLNGGAVNGATSARLVINSATAANAGAYTCIVSNAVGSVTSSAGTLAFVTTANPGRLGNLSVLSTFAAGQLLTMGFVTGGAGTSGSQALLVRADGPTLATFSIPNTMVDPSFSVIPLGSSIAVASNNNWGTPASNAAAVIAADAATGAFALVTGSLDAAEVVSLTPGGYTVQVTGTGSGQALTELYDTTPVTSYTLTMPRLANVSCLTTLPTGGILTAGFTIGGVTAKTVLIRASGPTLAASFNLTGAMADPQIVVQASGASTALAQNAGWGGDPQIAAAAASVYAFAFSSAASKDSAVLLTLAPGGYTAAVSSASGGSGTTEVEVYEIP